MNILKTNEKKETIIKQTIKQSNQNLKSILNISILAGSIGFLNVGLSSYYNKNFLQFLDASKIIFFPQGLTMAIYGFLGLILSINQIIILLSGIGEGFNEFDKKTRCLKILRKKTYSKNIELIYSFDDIESVIIDTKTSLLNQNKKLLIELKDKRKIPILESEETKKVEKEGSSLAYFLQVPLKGN